jgi:tetratricopeptide (TPR) repeat protein
MSVDKGKYYSLEDLLDRAQALMRQGRWRDALPWILQALDIAPDEPEALCLGSWAYLESKDLPRAKEFSERAINAAPMNEWGYRLRSCVLLRQGKKKESLAAAEEAVKLAPEEPLALTVLANAQVFCKKWPQARQTAERLRALTPEAAEPHLILGQIALRRKKWKEAEQHYRSALKLDPESYEAMNNLGEALYNRSRIQIGWMPVHRKRYLDEAIELFNRAAQIAPSRRIARANLRDAVVGYVSPVLILIVVAGFFLGLFGRSLAAIRWLVDVHSPNPAVAIVNLSFLIALLFLLIRIVSRFLTRHLPANVRLFLRAEGQRKFHNLVPTLLSVYGGMIFIYTFIQLRINGWLFFQILPAFSFLAFVFSGSEASRGW